MKKILVVGGTGFIGYHVIQEAQKKKWKITSISLKKPNKNRYLKRVKYLLVNWINYKSLKKKITGDFDYVVNAGGYGKHMSFNEGGDEIFNSHYNGLLNLIKIIPRRKLKRFIQIGSSAEYGEAPAPQNEDFHCSPSSPYGLAKFAGTSLLKTLYSSQKYPAVILRFFSVYGPKQDKNRVLPQIIDGCLKNKKFPVSKGNQYRDFCSVNDVVNAIFLSLNSKKVVGEIVNIGSGKPKKIKTVVKLVRKLIGKGKPQFGKIKYRENENMKLFPSIQKARTKLKWKPKTSFIRGLKITIESFK